MTAFPKKAKLTVAEYLAIENSQEWKSEFADGMLVIVPYENLTHNVIVVNLSAEIGTRLKGRPCRSLALRQRLRVE